MQSRNGLGQTRRKECASLPKTCGILQADQPSTRCERGAEKPNQTRLIGETDKVETHSWCSMKNLQLLVELEDSEFSLDEYRESVGAKLGLAFMAALLLAGRCTYRGRAHAWSATRHDGQGGSLTAVTVPERAKPHSLSLIPRWAVVLTQRRSQRVRLAV